MQLQLLGNYNAEVIMPQGKTKPVYSVDAAFKKDFLDGDLSLTLRVSDIFKTMKYDSETIGKGFILNSLNRRESQLHIWDQLQDTEF